MSEARGNGPTDLGLIDFSLAMAAFAGELYDHQAKGREWEEQTILFHVERGLKHSANASLWLKAAATAATPEQRAQLMADAKEDVLHAMSRAIFAVELYRRAHPTEEA